MEYDKLELDEVAGFLSVSNMRIEYDSTKYAKLVDQDKAPPVLLKIHIPQITLQGVKTPRALLENELIGEKLILKNPDVEIFYTMQGEDSARNLPTREVYEEILGGLDKIGMDTLAISGGNFKTNNLVTKRNTITLSGIDILMTDIRVDSTANEDSTRLFFSRNIYLACGNISWMSKDNLYKYEADSIEFDSDKNSVFTSEFNLIPQLGEDAFVNKLPVQDDRFDFTFRDISFRNTNFHQLIDENIVADSLVIGHASFKVYRDLAIPRDNRNRVGSYPQQVFMKIPINVSIGKLLINNSFIEYKERNHITRKSGKVQFFNTYAELDNVTNIKDSLRKNGLMKVYVSSKFLNSTPIRSTWSFYPDNSNGRFAVSGTVGSIESKNINQLAEPMGPAKIEEGTLDKLQFNLHGSNYNMNGTVTMLYSDLKVALLEKDKNSNEMDKKDFTSLFANIIIKNNNPSGNKDPRKATITNQRDVNRSLFNLTWKTLFKGMKETIGVKK